MRKTKSHAGPCPGCSDSKENEDSTDKEEAERLARAIEQMNVEWISIQDIEHNPLTDKYELKCRYQRYRGLIGGWTELRIKSPRQWIDLLTQRGQLP